MTSDKTETELDRIFSEIKTSLPKDWLRLSEELRLHFLLSSINQVLKPKGSWVLVNGEMTLLDLLNEKTNGREQC